MKWKVGLRTEPVARFLLVTMKLMIEKDEKLIRDKKSLEPSTYLAHRSVLS